MTKFTETINGNLPVLVDFYADWCGPCKMMGPILQRLAADLEGKAKILKIDVDKNPQAAQKYGVRNIPTMLIFKQGEVKWRGVGVHQADQLKSIIEKV
ncbi:MAG: thioredoxin [Bacteroidales bacterium]|nr:thioredoxin [Bacteroidales bacterium]